MADPSRLLDYPERTTTFSRRSRSDAAYKFWVINPAKLMLGVWLFNGASITGGLVFIIATVAEIPINWGLLLAVTAVGMGLGGIAAVIHFRDLDDRFMENQEARLEESVTERGYAPKEQPATGRTRTIRIHNVDGTSYDLNLEPWRLAYNDIEVELTPAQCDAQITRIAIDADEGRTPRFVYEPSPNPEGNISGSARSRVREVLLGLEYVEAKGAGLYWTRRGLEALAAWEKGK